MAAVPVKGAASTSWAKSNQKFQEIGDHGVLPISDVQHMAGGKLKGILAWKNPKFEG